MHEKAGALKNTYVELVLKTRNMYLDYHESHPGFFTSVVSNMLFSHILIAFNTPLSFTLLFYVAVTYG